MSAAFHLLASFRTTARWSRPGLDRAALIALQARALQRWLIHDVSRVAAYAHAPRDYADLPIVDKAALMADFSRYNRAGITAADVTAALRTDCRINGYIVGASTRTSANRGYFVISDAERYRWLGAILSKTMADLLWRRQCVAILLPQNTRLCTSARSVPRLDLRFFALTSRAKDWQRDLTTFDPTVIVAPPKVLRHLVETGLRLKTRRILCAAETLDPVDRAIIEASLGQIYTHLNPA